MNIEAVCSSSVLCFRSEDHLLLCMSVQYPSDMFHICSARTLQTSGRKHHMLALCSDVRITVSWDIQNARTAKKLEFWPLGIVLNSYCKLQFWCYNPMLYDGTIAYWSIYQAMSVECHCQLQRWATTAFAPSLTWHVCHGWTTMCTLIRDFPCCSVIAG